MNILENLSVTGKLHIVVKNSDNQVTKEVFVPNLVTTIGKQTFVQILAGTILPSSYITSMSVGTGTTTPTVADTALQTSVASQTLSSKTSSGTSITHIAAFPVGSVNASLTEAGLFNGTTMFARTMFPSLTITSADSVQITWTITLN